jgi:hypothetical protein
MQKGNLSRQDAINQAGLVAVEKVESENCEPTNRVGYNGAVQGDDLIEWSASVPVDGGRLNAYYYTTQDEIDEAGDDLSNVDWVIHGYEIQ